MPAITGNYTGSFATWSNNSSAIVSWQNNSADTVQWLAAVTFVGSVSAATSVALSQVSATGSVGTPKAVTSVAVTGNAAVASVGSVFASSSIVVSQVAATGSVGSVSPATTVGVFGNVATSALGQVFPSLAFALSQAAATGSVGSVSYQINGILTGVAATGSVGAVTGAISLGVSGVSSDTAVGLLRTLLSLGITGNSFGTGVGSMGTVTVLLPTATPGIVPNVVGILEWQAVYYMNQAYFNVGTTLYTPSNTVAQGTVISQSLVAGASYPYYTPMYVTVSSGPQQTAPTATVPNCIGLQAYQAGSLVAAAGLIINTFVYATSSVVAAGFVISQSLSAGSVVPTGTVISLTISLGAAPVAPTTTVPNVVGLYLWDAVRVLTQAQLIIEPWVYGANNTVAQEYVTSQSLTAGQSVPSWAPIYIFVSNGPF